MRVWLPIVRCEAGTRFSSFRKAEPLLRADNDIDRWHIHLRAAAQRCWRRASARDQEQGDRQLVTGDR